MPFGGYAFSLKAQKGAALTGASVTLPGGEHFDVLAGLEAGGGRIETTDASVARQLRRCPVLKELRPSPRSQPASRAARAKRVRSRRAAARTAQTREEV